MTDESDRDQRSPGLATQQMQAAVERGLFGRSDPPEIGRFVVTERLASGGMGTVFRAHDPSLNRRVAVKVLRSRFRSAESQETATARLLREAKTMARLNHPNVVTVHEVGMFEGSVFVAMEFVDGGTLADWMSGCEVGSKERLEQALDFAVQAARGLVAAHEAGVVHRDLKPANMLIDSRGRLRVADFGLASTGGPTTNESESVTGASAVSDETDEDLTATGELVGTPAYMAPEQVEGEATQASDQFSFCASFFEAVYGVAAFDGRTLVGRLEHIERGAVTEPGGGRQPAWLWSLLVRGLAADPGARHPDVASILRELETRRRPRRRALVYAALGTVAVGTTAAVYMAQGQTRCGDGEERLAEVWSAERRTAVEDALRASGLPFADPTSQRALEVADAYANAWVDAYEDSCTATWETGEQSERMLDLRMLCLDRRRSALDRVASTLVAGEADAVRKAVKLVESLPDLATCSDREGLQRRAEGKTPDQVEATQAAQLLFDEGDVAFELGRYQDAEAVYQRAVRAVEGVELDGMESFAASKMAQLRIHQGRFADASTQADRALRLATAGSDGDATCMAHIMLARVARDAAKPDEMRFHLDLADAALERGDSPRLRVGQLAQLRGWLAGSRGEADEAIREFDRAREVYEAVFGAGSVFVGEVDYNKGTTLHRAGRQDEALELFLASAAITARTLGDHHPGQAISLSGAAQVNMRRGKPEEALELNLRAFELLDADRGYKPQHRARAALMVADTYGRLAKFDEAMKWLERAEPIYVEVYGAEHPDTALVDFSRASLKLDRLNDFAGAAEDWRKVLARWEGVETKAQTSAIARVNLAVSESRAGQHTRAVASATQARAELALLTAPDGESMIGYLSSFGDVYRLAGKPDLAKEAYEKAVEISDAHGGAAS